MNRYIYDNQGKTKRTLSFKIVFGFLFFVAPFVHPALTFSQVFEFRRIAAGADTSEIYISCYWYDDDTTKWGGVFRSVDNGKTLSVQYTGLYPGIIVYGDIFGDSLTGALYNFMAGMQRSFDYGNSWENISTPITGYFEGTGGCLKGEVYIKGDISTGYNALYHGLYFGDSLFLTNTQMDSLLCIEGGSQQGEVYAIKYPYYGPSSDTLGLALSIDYGQTFTVNYLDTSIVSYLYHHTLAHGPDTGELYIAALDVNDRYHILRSPDYGNTWSLQYILPINWISEECSFVAGRKPGSFYILKTTVCASTTLHVCMWIYYSSDYGQTYTVYFHELDSTYTGISYPRSREKGLICYPNPVSGQLTVSWGRHSASAELRLYDLTGRLQLTTSLAAGLETTQIDVSSLKPGIYLLKATEGNMVIGTEKVVVK